MTNGRPQVVLRRVRKLLLVLTHILGWTQGAEVRNLALSLGERVARCRRFHQPERAG
jgi:hypothetical protein